MAFYRITLDHDFKGRRLQNVFCVEDESSLLTQESVALLIWGHWLPMFDGLQFSGMMCQFIEVRRIRVPDPLTPTLFQANRFCSGSLTPMLGTEAFKLLFKTDLAGKKHRGRYFIPGLAFGFVDQHPESLGPQGITRMTNIRNTILSKFCGGAEDVGLRLCIDHKDLSQTPTRVSTVQFSLHVHWVRSREIGRGI